MKKFKIIFNLITVALTTGLLVMITVAWYAVNKTASVTDGTGSVADIEKILDEVVMIKEGELVIQKNVDQIRDEEGKSVDGLFREVFKC